MNRIGAKSNSGEGGEDEVRFEVKPNGDWERFCLSSKWLPVDLGVTSYYLTNADELQIKNGARSQARGRWSITGT